MNTKWVCEERRNHVRIQKCSPAKIEFKVLRAEAVDAIAWEGAGGRRPPHRRSNTTRWRYCEFDRFKSSSSCLRTLLLARSHRQLKCRAALCKVGRSVRRWLRSDAMQKSRFCTPRRRSRHVENPPSRRKNWFKISYCRLFHSEPWGLLACCRPGMTWYIIYDAETLVSAQRNDCS